MAQSLTRTVNGVPVTITTTVPAEAVRLRAEGWEDTDKSTKSTPKPSGKAPDKAGKGAQASS